MFRYASCPKSQGPYAPRLVNLWFLQYLSLKNEEKTITILLLHLKKFNNSLKASSIKSEFRSHVSSLLLVFFLLLVCYLFLLFTFHLFESGSKKGSPIAQVVYLLSLLIYWLLFPLFFFSLIIYLL